MLGLFDSGFFFGPVRFSCLTVTQIVDYEKLNEPQFIEKVNNLFRSGRKKLFNMYFQTESIFLIESTAVCVTIYLNHEYKIESNRLLATLHLHVKKDSSEGKKMCYNV